MYNPIEQTNTRTQAYVDRLRRLPAELQPPYNWQEFQRRSQLRGSATAGGLDWTYVAAAAVVLLILCGVATWARMGTGGRSMIANSWEPAGRTTRHSDDSEADQAALAARHTRAIESWLATLPSEPPVVRVGTRADVARLEDNIAQVDDLLTSLRLGEHRPDRLAALQRERARLVGSLAQVRYAEVLASESP